MKTVLAILFSLLLTMPQTVFTAVADSNSCTAYQDRCPCARCPEMACCSSSGNNVPVRAPIAPAPNSAQKNFQTLIAITTPAFRLPAPVESISFYDSSFLSKVAAAPLYARNCSYVI